MNLLPLKLDEATRSRGGRGVAVAVYSNKDDIQDIEQYEKCRVLERGLREFIRLLMVFKKEKRRRGEHEEKCSK